MTYRITGPTVISFSGGRTSALLLQRCLDAGLDPDAHVLFCNTGREHPKTLDFVDEVARRWSVPITWLEYRRTKFPKYKSRENRLRQEAVCNLAGRTYAPSGKEPGYVEVTYATASRNGEPFENLIDLTGLPNYNAAFCSTELKTRVISRWMTDHGYHRWNSVVGVRSDESWRAADMRANSKKNCWTIVAPMESDGTLIRSVYDHWLGRCWNPGDPLPPPELLPQGFDLGLQPEDGNCIFCFKKHPRKLVALADRYPEDLKWCTSQETRTRSVWNGKMGPMARWIDMAKRQESLPVVYDPLPCGCTD